MQVLLELKAAPRPHKLKFMRYDMKFNRLTLEWETLEEVRRQGKYVRDAREEVGKDPNRNGFVLPEHVSRVTINIERASPPS